MLQMPQGKSWRTPEVDNKASKKASRGGRLDKLQRADRAPHGGWISNLLWNETFGARGAAVQQVPSAPGFSSSPSEERSGPAQPPRLPQRSEPRTRGARGFRAISEERRNHWRLTIVAPRRPTRTTQREPHAASPTEEITMARSSRKRKRWFTAAV